MLRRSAGFSARYARPYTGAIVAMSGLTLLLSLLTMVQPAILAAVLANLSGPARVPIPSNAPLLSLNYLGQRITQWIWGGDAGRNDLLILLGLVFVVQAVLTAVTTYFIDYGGVWLRTKIARLIQLDLLGHLMRQDMAFFTRKRAGELISRVTVDTVNTAQALGPLPRSLIQNSVQIAAYSAYLFSTSVWLTVGSIFLLGLQFGLTQLLKKPIRRIAL